MISKDGGQVVQELARSDLGKEVGAAIFDAGVSKLAWSGECEEDGSLAAYIECSKLYIGVLVADPLFQ